MQDLSQRFLSITLGSHIRSNGAVDQRKQHRPVARDLQRRIHHRRGKIYQTGGEQLAGLLPGHLVDPHGLRRPRQHPPNPSGNKPNRPASADQKRLDLHLRPHIIHHDQHPPITQHPPQLSSRHHRVGRGRPDPGQQRHHIGDLLGQLGTDHVLPDRDPHRPVRELLPHLRAVRHHPSQRRLPETTRTPQTRRHPYRASPGPQHRPSQLLHQLRARDLITPQRRHRPHRPPYPTGASPRHDQRLKQRRLQRIRARHHLRSQSATG